MNGLPLPGPLWLIGCGNMAGAMLEGWIAAGIDPGQVTVIRPSGRSVGHHIRVLTAPPEDEVPAMAMLGMKPYQLDAVAAELAPILGARTVLVSILAAIELATLRARFAAPRTIVKAMPNTPVAIRKGVVDLFTDSADADARSTVERLMSALGHTEWFEDETLFQAAGHLTGAGPAFLYRFIDALAAAGERLGLPAEQAARLAAAMVEGAGALAARSEDSPSALAERVASPGGTTRAGLDVLDESRALDALVLKTLEASRGRSLEMAAEGRGPD